MTTEEIREAIEVVAPSGATIIGVYGPSHPYAGYATFPFDCEGARTIDYDILAGVAVEVAYPIRRTLSEDERAVCAQAE